MLSYQQFKTECRGVCKAHADTPDKDEMNIHRRDVSTICWRSPYDHLDSCCVAIVEDKVGIDLMHRQSRMNSLYNPKGRSIQLLKETWTQFRLTKCRRRVHERTCYHRDNATSTHKLALLLLHKSWYLHDLVSRYIKRRCGEHHRYKHRQE